MSKKDQPWNTSMKCRICFKPFKDQTLCPHTVTQVEERIERDRIDRRVAGRVAEDKKTLAALVDAVEELKREVAALKTKLEGQG